MASFMALVASSLLGAAVGIAASNPVVAALVSAGLWSLWCAVDWKIDPPGGDA
jgi:hypothetical protein